VGYEWHRPFEARWITFTTLTFVAVIVGGLFLLIPPYFLQGTIQEVPGVRPYSALELLGRDIYIREGCNVCHSQMIRPLKTETDRYGPYSLAGEEIYDRPFLYGSRRTGPDLARIGGKYPDSWHWLHFQDPRRIEPRSNMPSFAFLFQRGLDVSVAPARLAGLRLLGHPYTDAQIQNAETDALAQAAEVVASLRGDGIQVSEAQATSEVLAVIAYLQSLGRAVTRLPVAAAAGAN
jgi:cytochrome c oxidase cbb3-type subunit I/II